MTKVDLQGDSPELVAYQLLIEVREAEWRYRSEGNSYGRKELLDLYAECFEAVKGNRKVRVSP